MKERFGRSMAIDSRIDTKTGEFDLVLASDGEASDGHILNIPGIHFPDSLPLQLEHQKSVTANLGTVSNFRPDTLDGQNIVRGVGRIRLTGDGEGLAARVDLVDAIDKGDVRGTSLWWAPVKRQDRRSLPKGHRAHVGRAEKDIRKRFGIYFEEITPTEHSIVGMPADKMALIGRSDAASSGACRNMWQTLVDHLDESPDQGREFEIITALEAQVAGLEERIREADQTRSSDTTPRDTPLPIDDCVRAMGDQIDAWRSQQRTEIAEVLNQALSRLSGVTQ